jgi:hypothetical protein
MNWTGGNFARHPRDIGLRTQRQKSFFAEARSTRPGRRRRSLSPLKLPFANAAAPAGSHASEALTAHPTRLSASVSGQKRLLSWALDEDRRQTVPTPRDASAQPAVRQDAMATMDHDAGVDEAADVEQLGSRLTHIAASPMDTLTDTCPRGGLLTPLRRRPEGASFEEQKKQLLRKEDWIGADVTRPLKVKYPAAADRDQVGKRRKVGRPCHISSNPQSQQQQQWRQQQREHQQLLATSRWHAYPPGRARAEEGMIVRIGDTEAGSARHQSPSCTCPRSVGAVGNARLRGPKALLLSDLDELAAGCSRSTTIGAENDKDSPARQITAPLDARSRFALAARRQSGNRRHVDLQHEEYEYEFSRRRACNGPDTLSPLQRLRTPPPPPLLPQPPHQGTLSFADAHRLVGDSDDDDALPALSVHPDAVGRYTYHHEIRVPAGSSSRVRLLSEEGDRPRDFVEDVASDPLTPMGPDEWLEQGECSLRATTPDRLPSLDIHVLVPALLQQQQQRQQQQGSRGGRHLVDSSCVLSAAAAAAAAADCSRSEGSTGPSHGTTSSDRGKAAAAAPLCGSSCRFAADGIMPGAANGASDAASLDSMSEAFFQTGRRPVAMITSGIADTVAAAATSTATATGGFLHATDVRLSSPLEDKALLRAGASAKRAPSAVQSLSPCYSASSAYASPHTANNIVDERSWMRFILDGNTPSV